MHKGQNIIKCKRSFIHDQAEGKEPNQLMLRADTLYLAPLLWLSALLWPLFPWAQIESLLVCPLLQFHWSLAGINMLVADGAAGQWRHPAPSVSTSRHCSLHSRTDNWDKPVTDDENQSRLSVATMELVSQCKKYQQSFYWMIFLKLNTVQRLCKRWIGFLSTSALSSFNYFGMNWLNVWRAPQHSHPSAGEIILTRLILILLGLLGKTFMSEFYPHPLVQTIFDPLSAHSALLHCYTVTRPVHANSNWMRDDCTFRLLAPFSTLCSADNQTDEIEIFCKNIWGY